MKVILRKDIDNLGEMGDVIKVKNGYGLNYLIPRGLAVVATPGAIRHGEELKRQASHKISQKKTDAETLAKTIENEPLVIKAKVGEGNRLFGTVTVQQIAVQLQNRGIVVDRRKIDLEDIRVTGEYLAAIKLHSEVTASLKVVVESEEEVEEVAEATEETTAETEASEVTEETEASS